MKILSHHNLQLDHFDDLRALACGQPEHLRVTLHPHARVRLANSGPIKDWGTSVLLLGGTGFVGVHLLRELLNCEQVQRVYAIVRGEDELAGARRLVEAANRYELVLPGGKFEADADADGPLRPTDHAHTSKLSVLVGDILAPRFGLDELRYRRLAEDVDTVMHVAGSPNYRISYERGQRPWVMQLLSTVEFCTERRIKQLTYVGSTIANVFERRDDFARTDSFWHCGYSRMKWVNQHILSSLADSGLRLTLCQAPYVLASTSGGADPGMRYALWRALRIACSLGVLYYGTGAAFIPVDIMCHALICNMLASQSVHTLCPVLPTPYDNALLAKLMGIELVDWTEFYKRITDRLSRSLTRIFPEDLLRLVRLTNVPARYPASFPVETIPRPEMLLPGYLRTQRLVPRTARTSAFLPDQALAAT